MFLGILIALLLFGILMIAGNHKHANTNNGATIMLAVGLFCALVGACGAFGWLAEVLL